MNILGEGKTEELKAWPTTVNHKMKENKSDQHFCQYPASQDQLTKVG